MIAQEKLFAVQDAPSTTRVVHCKREKHDVYIGRPVQGLKGSIWANPFHIGKDGTREEVIKKYREYILGKPELLAQLESLKGKVLGCWCKPEKDCHGDVLVELLSDGIPPTNKPNYGPCVKCGSPSELKSPGGSVYCQKHGYCARRTCLKSVEKFVMHPRMGIYVCSCVVKFEEDMQKYQEEVKRREEAMIRTGN